MSDERIRSSVHIIPLGYEIDRAIRPFDSEVVDHVYLLTMKSSDDGIHRELEKASRIRYFESRVKGILLERGIQVTVTSVDISDVFEVMNAISSIIIEEKKKGAKVNVNMSACGKITAYATIMASMANDASLYYVRADRIAETDQEIINHGLSICQQSRVYHLGRISLALPDAVQSEVLSSLANAPQGLSSLEILDLTVKKCSGKALSDQQEDNLSSVEPWDLHLLKKKVIDPLLSAGYISEQGELDKQFSITPDGEYIVALQGKIPARS